MDCREFRERHAPFVDLMCSMQDEREMREHLKACAACTRHDTRIRRSLMMVRSLPTIEPSANFRARLDARLREVRASERHAGPRPARFAAARSAALAAGIALISYAAVDLLRGAQPPEIAMPPVVASLPAEALQAATPAMVAAVPTGMSVWPAIMFASQAQIQLVAAELASER